MKLINTKQLSVDMVTNTVLKKKNNKWETNNPTKSENQNRINT
jgi:hypothetical protein